MDASVAKGMINLIRAEKQRRYACLAEEDPESAYDRWLCADEPIFNELCLMLLVAIRHQLEGELVLLRARVTNDGKDIDGEQYQKHVADQGKLLKRHGWERLTAALNLDCFAEWKTSMETLRLLANCCKHSPSHDPDKLLLEHLGLNADDNYAPLPESRCFREGLAESVDLQRDADYCDIAAQMLKLTEEFLAKVQQQPMLSRVVGGSWFSIGFDAIPC
jgi:hypothetical protein